MSSKSANWQKLVPLDEFDAICDEFLKVFELVDTEGAGLIDAVGFSRLKGVMSGGNILRLPLPVVGQGACGSGGLVQRNELQRADFQKQGVKALSSVAQTQKSGIQQTTVFSRGRRGATVTLVGQANSMELMDLSLAARQLFESKRCAVLALSFEDIPTSIEGALAADELLSAIGLSGPTAYTAEIMGLSADVFGNLWPNMVEADTLPQTHEQFEQDQDQFNYILHRILGGFIEPQSLNPNCEHSPC